VLPSEDDVGESLPKDVTKRRHTRRLSIVDAVLDHQFFETFFPKLAQRQPDWHVEETEVRNVLTGLRDPFIQPGKSQTTPRRSIIAALVAVDHIFLPLNDELAIDVKSRSRNAMNDVPSLAAHGATPDGENELLSSCIVAILKALEKPLAAQGLRRQPRMLQSGSSSKD
jgi:hypothetical protein